MLAEYYDCKEADNFDMLFGGLWIHEQPTVNKNRFLVLKLDFSKVMGDLSKVEESFDRYCSIAVETFADKYETFFYKGFVADIKAEKTASSKLVLLTQKAEERRLPLYLIIDEYDNFTNNILNAVGLKEYKDITHGVGFYRDTFKLFKGSFDRILMIGVSPVTVDDLTSGYNIATNNISMMPEFNAILGFSETELRGIIDYYREARCFDTDTDSVVRDMKPWYDNNCFSPEGIDKPRAYNSNMALHYMRNMVSRGCPPSDMLDPNVRTDYSKLRRLIEIDGSDLNRKGIIQSIVDNGYVRSRLVNNFPAERIGETENYISLLFYYGMLTIVDADGIEQTLGIPNHCVREMYYSYLRDIYNEDSIVDLSEFSNAFRAMAYDGNPEPFVVLVSTLFRESTSVRTLIGGERSVQAFILAYLKLTPYFVCKTEKELNHGYADLVLLPNPLSDSTRHAYIIELKYISKKKDTEAARQSKMAEAEEQLKQYAADKELTTLKEGVQLHTLALVFTGEEMVTMSHNAAH